MKYGLLGCLLIIIGYALSWLITIGLVWLICLCFKLAFSLAIATGIWFVIILLKSIFGGSSKG